MSDNLPVVHLAPAHGIKTGDVVQIRDGDSYTDVRVIVDEPPTLASVQALIDRLAREDRAKLRVHLLAKYEDDGSAHRRVHDST